MKREKITVIPMGNIYKASYILDVNDVVDAKVYDMSRNGMFPQMIPCDMQENGGVRTFEYTIDGMRPLPEILKSDMGRRDMLTVIYNVLESLETFGKGMVSLSYVAKETQHIFVSPESYDVKFIVAPVDKEFTDMNEVRNLIKTIIVDAKYSEADADNYVARLINYVNMPGTFSSSDMKNRVKDLLMEMGAEVPESGKNIPMNGMGMQRGSSHILRSETPSPKVSRLGVMRNNARMNGQVPPMGPNGMPMNGMPPMGPNGVPMNGMPPMGPNGMPMNGAMPPVGPNGVPMNGMPMNGAMPPMGPNGMPMNGAMPPMGPNGMPMNGAMPPMGPNGMPMNGAMPPMGPNGMPMNGAMPPMGPNGMPMNGAMPPMPEGVNQFEAEVKNEDTAETPVNSETPETMLKEDAEKEVIAEEEQSDNKEVAEVIAERPKNENPFNGAPMPKMPPMGNPFGGAPVPPMGNPLGETPVPPMGNPFGGAPVPPMGNPFEVTPPMNAAENVTEQPDNIETAEPTVEQPDNVETVEPMVEQPRNENSFDEVPIPQTPPMGNPFGGEPVPPMPQMPPIGNPFGEMPVPPAAPVGMPSSEGPAPYFVRTRTGERIDLDKAEFKIGHKVSDVDYVVSDNSAISRVHCVITKRNGVCFIRDNHSTNGTYINGDRLNDGEERFLTNNAFVILGNEEFVYHIK